MALSDFFNRGKIRQLESQMQALINRVQYEWWVNNGVANYMVDDPHEYLTKGYQSNASVYGIINHINNMRKQALFRLVDENKQDIEHPDLSKFLVNVNKNTTTDDFIGQLIIYYLIIGEFFAAKSVIDAGLNKGKAFDLTCLPSADVKIIEGDFFEPVRGYKIEGHYNIELPKEVVYHGKMFNPNWFSEQSLHGMSPLRAAARVVSKLNQIEETEQKGYENQGPPYILQRKSTADSNIQNHALTDGQREDLESNVKKKTSPKYRGLPLISKLQLEKIDLGSTINDMRTIESSNSGIISLCNIYGFPPELAGYGQKTYSNMATARKAAWTDCIMPLMKVIEDCFNRSLIEPIDEYKKQKIRFMFDFSEVEELSEGMETKVGWMVSAGWSGNMIYEATGQPRSDNPIMDEPRLPMGTTLASDYNATDELDNTLKSFEDYK